MSNIQTIDAADLKPNDLVQLRDSGTFIRVYYTYIKKTGPKRGHIGFVTTDHRSYTISPTARLNIIRTPIDMNALCLCEHPASDHVYEGVLTWCKKSKPMCEHSCGGFVHAK